MNLNDLLKESLTQEEIEKVPTSYDVVGDILIFADFPKELKKKQRFVGNCFLKYLKQVKVVCKKSKKYSCKYFSNIQKYQIEEPQKY